MRGSPGCVACCCIHTRASLATNAGAVNCHQSQGAQHLKAHGPQSKEATQWLLLTLPLMVVHQHGTRILNPIQTCLGTRDLLTKHKFLFRNKCKVINDRPCSDITFCAANHKSCYSQRRASSKNIPPIIAALFTQPKASFQFIQIHCCSFSPQDCSASPA